MLIVEKKDAIKLIILKGFAFLKKFTQNAQIKMVFSTRIFKKMSETFYFIVKMCPKIFIHRLSRR